jgi:predicted HicB family RNase H-like nuclease
MSETNETKLRAYAYAATVRKSEITDEPWYIAESREFAQSVVGEGATPEEALKVFYDEVADALSDLHEAGRAVPEPEPFPEWISYSGKMTLRTSKSLHRKLNLLAEDEGVSLNHLVNDLLAEGAERRRQREGALNAVASRPQVYRRGRAVPASVVNEKKNS